MADDVAITAGSGTTIATDDVSGKHYQKFKLFSAEADSAEGIGDLDHGSTRSLWVHPRPDTVQAQVNSAGLTTASTAYVAGDTLGTGWQFSTMAKASAGTGRIIGLEATDYADVLTQIIVYFASGSITFGTDNAAPSISDADSLKLLGKVTLDFTDLGANRFASIDSLAIPYVCDGTDIYVYATTASGHTFFGAATDIKLRVFAIRD